MMGVAGPPAARLRAGVVLLYVVVSALTASRTQGDTIDYVRHVRELTLQSWDFGHLWWQPLGWLLAGAWSPAIDWPILVAFLAVNWLAGLVAVVFLLELLLWLGLPAGVALATTTAFLCSQALLSYLHTGCSYVPGLAFLVLALYLIVSAARRQPSPSMARAFAAGLAMAASICFWFPYCLVSPAVLLSPLLLVAFDRARLGVAVYAALGLALLLAVGYGTAAACVGVSDVASFRAWMSASAHGIETRGLARAGLGLARSFVSLGDDGLLFKRFLLKDPYNPVTLPDLLAGSLWKIAAFYLAMLALAVGLLRTPQGRRVLALLVLGGGPVFVFGVYWQGGDMERYLPLYPFLFVAVAALLASGWAVTRLPVAAFFAVVVVVNGVALSSWQVGAYRRQLTSRVAGLEELRSPSEIVVVRDNLKLLPRDFPLEPGCRELPVVEIATPGLASTPKWRRELAERVLRAWRQGGEVWVSRRLTADRPRPDSTWAEGDDPRLKWAELSAYFRRLRTDRAVGGDDGFVRVARDPANEALFGAAE